MTREVNMSTTRKAVTRMAVGLAIAATTIGAGGVVLAQTGTGGSEPPTGTDSQTTEPTVQVLPSSVNAGAGGAAELLAP